MKKGRQDRIAETLTLSLNPYYTGSYSMRGQNPVTRALCVSVSAILSCRPFFILIFLRCIKMKHYGFSRKSIWKNLETFP